MHGIRTDFVKKNAIEQTGDHLFNEINKNLSENDLKILQLEKINFLYEVFILIKENNPKKFSIYQNKIIYFNESLIFKSSPNPEDNLNNFKRDVLLFIKQRQTIIFFNIGKSNFILSNPSLVTLSSFNSNKILYYYFIIYPKIIIF